MFDSKNSIIFCILLIAVGVRSYVTVLDFDDRYGFFKQTLVEAEPPLGYSIRSHSLDYWDNLSVDFKKNCLNEYEARLDENDLRYESGKPVALGKLAYAALIEVCKDAIEQCKTLLPKGDKLISDLDEIQFEKDILHYLAFMDHPPFDDQQLSKMIDKTKNPEQAIFEALFNEYKKKFWKINFKVPQRRLMTGRSF